MPRITVTDIDRRVIRVFLSSTFADLDSERTYLARQVFPRLRRELMKYNITLMDIDLRWGITEDEAKSGKTVKLCLEQIENTKPFFIGILGNRYGWVPDKEYLEDIPLSENDRGKSVTEIEIRHGALDLPENSDAAFFIKNTDEDFGEEDYKKNKLSDLKGQLDDSPYPVSHFQSVEELGDLVEEAVMSWVRKYYDLDTLDRKGLIAAEQNHMLGEYLDGFVTCEAYEQIIDSFISDYKKDNNNHILPLMATGGSGKRAFAAYAAAQLKERGLARNIVQYYFEDNCGEQGIEDAVDYLTDSMKAQFPNLDTSDYNYQYSLPEVLNRLLMHVVGCNPEDGPWVLALGGINLLPKEKLEDWLRLITFTQNSVIVIFTASGGLHDRMLVEKYVGKISRQVGGLFFKGEELAELIRRYFEPYGKTLNDDYITSIINSKTHISGYNVYRNMGHLHLMLNELRIFGDFDHIGDYIASLTECSYDEARFLSRLVGNWSKAFDHNGNRMVETVLNLLATLDYGLAENDILDYVKAPAANWQQFLAAAEPFLYTHEGRYYIHEVYRSAFSVVFTDTIKPFRYDWVAYMEKKVAEEGYVPDYMLYELVEIYRHQHFILDRHLKGEDPDYFIPECFTAELRYDPDDLLGRLFRLAGNIDWMIWLLDRGEQVLLKKVFGFLKQHGRRVDAYMQQIAEEKDTFVRCAEGLKLARLYQTVGCHTYAIRTCHMVEDESLRQGDKLRLYHMLTCLYHEVGEKEKTEEYSGKAMDLCSDVGEDRLPEAAEMELVAMLMDSIPLERVDKNILLDFIEDAGEATIEKHRPMEIVLDLLQKKFAGDNDMSSMICDLRVQMYEGIGMKDDMRIHMAHAYFLRAGVLKDMNKYEESFWDFYKSFLIYEAVRGKNDYDVADMAYASYMIVILSNHLQIGVDYWRVLSGGISCMQLLLYYRQGWDQLSWLMERILRYMDEVTSMPQWEEDRRSYLRYKEEYEKYQKRS